MFEDYKLKKHLKESRKDFKVEPFLLELRSKLKKHMEENPAVFDFAPQKENAISLAMAAFFEKLGEVPFGNLKTNPKFVRVAAVLLAVIFAGGGIAMASQESLPGEPLYPVKILSEDIRYSITLKPEDKAKLHATFAVKRVDEIKEILSKKGVEPKGLDQAISRLQYNASKATDAVSEKKKETDAEQLAKNINDVFNEQKKELKETFKFQEEDLKDQEAIIKDRIRESKKDGSGETLNELEKELDGIKDERKNLLIRRNESVRVIKDEKKEIRKKMDEKDKAEESRREISEDVADLSTERKNLEKKASENGANSNSELFSAFDEFMIKINEASDKKEFDDAEMLLENARMELERTEEGIEEAIEKAKDEKYKKENEDKDHSSGNDSKDRSDTDQENGQED